MVMTWLARRCGAARTSNSWHKTIHLPEVTNTNWRGVSQQTNSHRGPLVCRAAVITDGATGTPLRFNEQKWGILHSSAALVGFEGPHYCTTTAAACIIGACAQGAEGQEICICGSNTILTTALRWKTMPFGPHPAILFIYLSIYVTHFFLKENTLRICCSTLWPSRTSRTSMGTSVFSSQSHCQALFSTYIKTEKTWVGLYLKFKLLLRLTLNNKFFLLVVFCVFSAHHTTLIYFL